MDKNKTQNNLVSILELRCCCSGLVCQYFGELGHFCLKVKVTKQWLGFGNNKVSCYVNKHPTTTYHHPGMEMKFATYHCERLLYCNKWNGDIYALVITNFHKHKYCI